MTPKKIILSVSEHCPGLTAEAFSLLKRLDGDDFSGSTAALNRDRFYKFCREALILTKFPDGLREEVEAAARHIEPAPPSLASTRYVPLAQWAREHRHRVESARTLVHRGKLPQAEKLGRDWILPEDTPWPEDRRYKRV